MFCYNDTIDVLDAIRNDEYSEGKATRFFRKLFDDNDFKAYLFKNPTGNLVDASQKIEKMYSIMSKNSMLNIILNAVEEKDYQYDRTIACMLYAIVCVSSDRINETTEKITTLFKEEKINQARKEIEEGKLRKSKRIVDYAFKCIRKIVKKKAKRIYKESGIPRDLAEIACYSVPEPEMINAYQVGMYLNHLLATIYEHTENMNVDTDMVDWKEFMKDIFGKNNVLEVATFVLLEGQHRLGKFKSDKVKACWQSLTKFGLDELEMAPQKDRIQMIDIYIKRIEKMFANNSIVLRVNLLTLSREEYPHLTSDLDSYRDKIMTIMDSAKK